MGTVGSSKTSVIYHKTAQHHKPQDHNMVEQHVRSEFSQQLTFGMYTHTVVPYVVDNIVEDLPFPFYLYEYYSVHNKAITLKQYYLHKYVQHLQTFN
jgi:hypothetical protein